MGSLLFKKDKFSLPEAHVDRELKNLFLDDVSNWQIKLRKIKGNLNFWKFVSSV